jgi:molecular chaperone HtpG
VPEWLRFVRGIVDSDDLPLNVSRELVQEHKIVGSIRKNVTKKVIDVLEEMAKDRPDDYRLFWENFGVVLKEGLHYEPTMSSRLAELVRFESSMGNHTSLADYVERMMDGQKAIYYVTGPSKKAVQGGAHMEALQKKGYEVLFMTDAVDEFALQGLTEYGDFKLQSAMQADLDLDENQTDDERKETEARTVELEDLVVRIQADLEETVSEVRISQRLTDSPCCLVTPEGGLSAHVERMLRAQNANMPAAKRIFEINADHPVIEQLRSLQEGGNEDEKLGEWVALLHDQALLAEGSPIPDPQGFSRRLTHLMTDRSVEAGD